MDDNKYSIKIDYLGGPAWIINIKPMGENYSFTNKVQAFGQVNEEMALGHFLENTKDYVIDISGELVKD